MRPLFDSLFIFVSGSGEISDDEMKPECTDSLVDVGIYDGSILKVERVTDFGLADLGALGIDGLTYENKFREVYELAFLLPDFLLDRPTLPSISSS